MSCFVLLDLVFYRYSAHAQTQLLIRKLSLISASFRMNLTSPSLPGTYSGLHLVVDADGDEPKGEQTAV